MLTGVDNRVPAIRQARTHRRDDRCRLDEVGAGADDVEGAHRGLTLPRPRVVHAAAMAGGVDASFQSIWVSVPAVDGLVDGLRVEGDWARGLGVPAHVTLA